MRQITANVYLFPEVRGAHVGYVTTSEGIVMIDTPMLPTDAVKWRNDMAQRGEVRYIVNTHHHYDHIAGNSLFPGTVVSHEGVRELFSAPVERFMAFGLTDKDKEYSLVDFIRRRLEQRDPEGAPWLAHYQLRAPTITFSERLNLYVGEHTFELIHLPGHTPSHIGGLYTPGEGFLCWR